MAQVARLRELQELQSELARASFVALGDEAWVTARRSFLEAGDVRFGRNHFLRKDGSRGSVRSPRTIMELWSRLRSAMVDGEAGTWFSAELEVTAQGRFSFEFNWDLRPWTNTRGGLLDAREPGTGPADDDWLADLRVHPRGAGRVPPWLAAIAAAPPSPEGRALVVQPEALAARFPVLADEPEWARMMAALARHAAELARQRVYRLPEDGDAALEVEETFVVEVVRATLAEQLPSATVGDAVRLLRRVRAAGAEVVEPASWEADPAASLDDRDDTNVRAVRSALIDLLAAMTETMIAR